MFSQLYLALPRAGERWAACGGERETTSSQQPPLRELELGIAALSLGSFSLFSPRFLPNMCFQTPTLLCHQRLFFAYFLAVLHQCSHQWSSTWKRIRCLFPKPSGCIVILYVYLPKKSNSSPQTQTTLLPNTCVLAWTLSSPRWLSAESVGVLPWLVFGEGCWFSGVYSESQVKGGNTALLKLI